jgi:hypothetical protein
MAMRIERTEGHYEAQETSYGEAYVCDARSASCWSVSVGKGCRLHGPGQGGAGVGRGNASLDE